MECHSQTVGHRKRCDQTAFHKMCNLTHSLLAIGKDVMRLPFTKCSITHPLVIRCDETACHKICNVTHQLLVEGKDMVRLPFKKCTILLTGWSQERDDETAFHKICNITHKLLVIDVMTLPFTKCAMSLTDCWS